MSSISGYYQLDAQLMEKIISLFKLNTSPTPKKQKPSYNEDGAKKSLNKDHEESKLNAIKRIPYHLPDVVAATSFDSKIHMTTNLLAAHSNS